MASASLWRSTMVAPTVNVPVSMATISPPKKTPPESVWGAVVHSSGIGGVMKRLTYSVSPSPVSARPRAFAPTGVMSSVPLKVSMRATAPRASSATNTR